MNIKEIFTSIYPPNSERNKSKAERIIKNCNEALDYFGISEYFNRINENWLKGEGEIERADRIKKDMVDDSITLSWGKEDNKNFIRVITFADIKDPINYYFLFQDSGETVYWQETINGAGKTALKLNKKSKFYIGWGWDDYSKEYVSHMFQAKIKEMYRELRAKKN